MEQLSLADEEEERSHVSLSRSQSMHQATIAHSSKTPKSLFGSMGKVRHINHFREKWNARSRPQALSMSRSLETEEPVRKSRKSSSSQASPRMSSTVETHRPLLRKKSARRLSSVDMERLEWLTKWLKDNKIEVHDQEITEQEPTIDAFDGVLSAIEQKERQMESELSLRHDTWTMAHPTNPLFDYMVVLGPDLADLAIQSTRYPIAKDAIVLEPTVVFAWPPECQFYATSIEHFCFPSGITTQSHRESCGAEFFVLVLSGGGLRGDQVQYACCRKSWLPYSHKQMDLWVPVCYCVVCKTPFIEFFNPLLDLLYDRHQQDLQVDRTPLMSLVSDDHMQTIDHAMKTLQSAKLPDPGTMASIELMDGYDRLPFKRLVPLSSRSEPSFLLLRWSLPILLRHLAIDSLLRILGLILMEMKILFVCKDLSMLSAATLGLTELLHPLAWAGPLISILPPRLYEYTEAPVPLVCGLDQLPTSFEISQGTVVVWIREGKIEMHQDDAHDFNSAMFPMDDMEMEKLRLLCQRADAIDHVIERIGAYVLQILHAASEVHSKDPSTGSFRFLSAIVQTQMYQKYCDDKKTPVVVESKQQEEKQEEPATAIERIPSSRQVDWHSNLSALFQIAFCGEASLDFKQVPKVERQEMETTDATPNDAKTDDPGDYEEEHVLESEHASLVAEAPSRRASISIVSTEVEEFEPTVEMTVDAFLSMESTTVVVEEDVVLSCVEASEINHNQYSEEESHSLSPNDAVGCIQRAWRSFQIKKQLRVTAPVTTELFTTHCTTTEAFKLSQKTRRWYKCRLYLDHGRQYMGWQRCSLRERSIYALAMAEITQIEMQAATNQMKHNVLRIQTSDMAFSFLVAVDSLFVQALRDAINSRDWNESSQSVTTTESSPSKHQSQSQSHASGKTKSRRQSMSIITRLSATDLTMFTTALQRGFLVQKHGRRGKPHARILFSDDTCSQIQWKTAALDSFLFPIKSISIASVEEIVRGKQTSVLKRSVSRHVDEALCLSIITNKRTLDLSLHSLHEVDVLFHGLNALVHQL